MFTIFRSLINQFHNFFLSLFVLFYFLPDDFFFPRTTKSNSAIVRTEIYLCYDNVTVIT